MVLSSAVLIFSAGVAGLVLASVDTGAPGTDSPITRTSANPQTKMRMYRSPASEWGVAPKMKGTARAVLLDYAIRIGVATALRSHPSGARGTAHLRRAERPAEPAPQLRIEPLPQCLRLLR